MNPGSRWALMLPHRQLMIKSFWSILSMTVTSFLFRLKIPKTSWVCKATLEFDYRLGPSRVGDGIRLGLGCVWVWVGFGLRLVLDFVLGQIR